MKLKLHLIKKSRTVGLAIVSLCLFSMITIAQETHVLKFDTSIADDATFAVWQALHEVNQEQLSKITFQKGVYNFYPDRAAEKYCYISNHDDALTRIAFPLNNARGLTIDGQGSTFIFHGVIIPFLIENSQHINIKNLTIDWAMSFHSEGRVVANDAAQKTFDLRISPEYPYEIRNGQLYFIKEYYEHDMNQAIMYNPEKHCIAYDTDKMTPLSLQKKGSIQFHVEDIKYKYDIHHLNTLHRNQNQQFRMTAEQLEPGLVRFHNTKKQVPTVGLQLICKGSQDKNRVCPAIKCADCNDVKVNNVTIHHAGGMGFLAENCANITLDHYRVLTSQGRMVSTTADATHFVGCRGEIKLLHCDLENQLDDAMNVHGTYEKIINRLDKYSVGSQMGHFQQQGFCLAQPGDTIGLIRLSNSFFPYNKLTVKTVDFVNGHYNRIVFNEPLPDDLQPGDLLENLSAYPHVTVDHCTIKHNRARGLLISTPKGATITNNYFETEMEPILMPVESSSWFESGNAADVIIRHNIFQDGTIAGKKRGVIRLVTDDNNRNIAFKNIEVSENTFNRQDAMLLEINNVDGFLFKNNVINTSTNYKPMFPNAPAIVIHASKNVKFEKNKYNGIAKTLLDVDPAMGKLKFK